MVDLDFDDDEPRSACYGATCGNYALPDDVLCARCRDEVSADVAHEEALIDEAEAAALALDHEEAKNDDARLALVPRGSIPWNLIVREV